MQHIISQGRKTLKKILLTVDIDMIQHLKIYNFIIFINNLHCIYNDNFEEQAP
jgi:hypothetical protein